MLVYFGSSACSKLSEPFRFASGSAHLLASHLSEPFRKANCNLPSALYTPCSMTDTQPASKKRRVCQITATVEMHVAPDIHNLYGTTTVHSVAAEALQIVTEACSRAEQMLYEHNSKVTGTKPEITPEMVNISSSVNSQQWTRIL